MINSTCRVTFFVIKLNFIGLLNTGFISLSLIPMIFGLKVGFLTFIFSAPILSIVTFVIYLSSQHYHPAMLLPGCTIVFYSVLIDSVLSNILQKPINPSLNSRTFLHSCSLLASFSGPDAQLLGICHSHRCKQGEKEKTIRSNRTCDCGKQGKHWGRRGGTTRANRTNTATESTTTVEYDIRCSEYSITVCWLTSTRRRKVGQQNAGDAEKFGERTPEEK